MKLLSETTETTKLIFSVIKPFTLSNGSSPAPAPNFMLAEMREDARIQMIDRVRGPSNPSTKDRHQRQHHVL